MAAEATRLREHVADFRGRALGVLGARASSMTLAWLASHRDRFRTVLLGGHRLSVLVIWDRRGGEKVDRSGDDERAIYQLTYGEPMPEERPDA